ncbi:MAG: D-alanyl-D-alanine carboxypeptidase/D-alanyl-D-alanine-endopeptidase [Bacteroidales bacterium]|nr:D-alanyl-D-alanine carboxypeptidase/D-alanyl-D-alanine-endopeptidase [Bacteroidales bacterium]
MKKIYCGAMIALASIISLSADAERLNFSGRDAATIGVYITNLSTGQAVERENINMSMIPASILKSVTSATALNLLKGDFRFNTDVMLSGTLSGGVLNGNLVVKASGDPTVESSHFTDREGFIASIVSGLKSKGVTTIKGEIIVDEEMFSDTGQVPQWVIEDTGWDYGAGFYGFNYNNNTFRLYTETQKTVPEVPYIDVIIDKNTSSTDIERGMNSDLYIVSGRNVENPNFYVTTTMNSPALAFVHNLRERLKKNGITVEENVIDSTSGETLLLRYYSPVNTEMLRTLMFKSDNLMAEATLRALAPGQSRDAAIKKELAFWKNRGISTDYIKIADGSGLARVDRVTPKFMEQVLTHMAKSSMADTYVSLFPKVGKEGTVRNFLKGTALDGKLVLKSGSMNGVHCYAGYKLGSNGKPTHSVVIIVNNFFCTRDALRKEIQRFLLAVFK